MMTYPTEIIYYNSYYPYKFKQEFHRKVTTKTNKTINISDIVDEYGKEAFIVLNLDKCDYNYGHEYFEYDIMIWDIETEEEFQKRLKRLEAQKIAKLKKIKEEQEKEQRKIREDYQHYLKLKERFENDPSNELF